MAPLEDQHQRKPHLFLSHSTNNKVFVKQLANDLRELGVEVHLDVWEKTAGESLFQKLAEAGTTPDYIGLVISNDFNALKWNSSELKHALVREAIEGHAIVLPLLIEETPLPSFIEKRIPIDFTGGYYCALAHLAGIIHQLNPRDLQQGIETYNPKQMYDSIKVLRVAGLVS